MKINLKFQWLCITFWGSICSFFFLKSYRATAWCTKEIKCGGSNLMNINFTSISSEVKFIDTLKYYPKSLAELFCKAIDKTIFKFSPLFSWSLVFFRNWTKKKGSWYYCRWKSNNSLWKNCWYEFAILNSRKQQLFWKNWIL